jgi:hypothetical protein
VSFAEVVLSYEQNRWRARGAGVDVTHAELAGLEGLIATELTAEHAPLDVHVRFDMAVLPRWLHQYHDHYCNYVLHLMPRGTSA